MSAPAQPKTAAPGGGVDERGRKGRGASACPRQAAGGQGAEAVRPRGSEDSDAARRRPGADRRVELEGLVEEFAQKFSSGINFVGTEKEVKSMLSDVMGEDQLAGVMSDEQEEPGETPERIWDKISKIKDEALRAYLRQGASADSGDDPLAHRSGARRQDRRVVPGAAAQHAAHSHARHQEGCRRRRARRGDRDSGGPARPNRRRARMPALPIS